MSKHSSPTQGKKTQNCPGATASVEPRLISDTSLIALAGMTFKPIKPRVSRTQDSCFFITMIEVGQLFSCYEASIKLASELLRDRYHPSN